MSQNSLRGSCGRRLRQAGGTYDCLCNKFSTVGNLSDGFQLQKYCFDKDPCGGSQYSVLTNFVYSTDCPNMLLC
ncbi:uncharacterized protein HaLaN_24691 [Haematococcus lacustris]|uniref:Uncharacterized protein n=1 Tax=Haematococcus lacustris TaxID=44745 RepID=A0A6A0A2R8_HAELA|nr:uncharacterized protein HaLaN_24691 [Haematococcus lacustris]